MNRIYQGRVAQVQIPNPDIKGEWLLFHRDLKVAREITERIPELRQQVESEIAQRGKMCSHERERKAKSPELQEYERLRALQENERQDTLWAHHEMFQDAVNYYAFALAVMADGMTERDEEGKEEPTAMARFGEQVLGNDKPTTDANYVEGRWEGFSHKGKKRSGLKHSMARTLGLDPTTITREGCLNRIFGHAFGKFPKKEDGKLNDIFHGVIGELFPAKSRGKPQELANEDPGWLCWKEKSGEPPAAKTYRKQQGVSDFMDKLFRADREQLIELSKLSVQESSLSGVEESEHDADKPVAQNEANASPSKGETEDNALADDDAGYLVGDKAVAELDQCVKSAKTLLQDDDYRFMFNRFGGDAIATDIELKRLDELVAAKRMVEENRQKESPKSESSFRFQNWKRSGLDKDNIRVELFVLFHCDGGSEFSATLLKARLIQKKLYLPWLHSNDKLRYVAFVDQFKLCGAIDGQEPEAKVEKARKAAAKSDYKPATSSVQKTDFIPRIKKELGYVFPSFTAMRGFAAQSGDPKETNGACRPGYFGWSKFDYAAYEEAIKSPHQIRQKQKERDKEAKRLEELKKLYEGKGREKGKSDDGEDEDFIPGGFTESGGDPRYAAMRRIHGALAVADGADPSMLYRYGISQAALRGYEELREAWNKEIKPDEPFSDEKAGKLKGCITTQQREHRDDMGDSRFFEELTKEDNWCVWQATKPETEGQRVSNRYSANIVRDYLRYCDVLEDLEKKQRPVQYTPADARDSRRLFDFKGASQGGFEHLTNQDGLSFTTQIAVKSGDGDEELYRPKNVRICYTAPRLMRDEARVLSENEDLKSANWAQPFMRALGIPEDDRHNFKKHAVSLMPDWKPASQSPGPDRLLLNFVLTPKEDKFIAHLRKQMGREAWPWTMQFAWNGDGHDSTLRWPHEDWSKVKEKKEFPGSWFGNPKLKSFRLLSVDLGQKQAGAYAIIEVSCELSEEERKNARFIGRTEHKGERRDWYARVVTIGLLKLSGEDARAFREGNEYDRQRAFARGKTIPNGKGLHEEFAGSAGRLASGDESKKTVALLTEMQQPSLLDDDPSKAEEECERLTFPEQNTKLLIAFGRAQSFASKLHRWCWFLDPQDDVDRKDQAARRRTAIKEIAEADKHEWLDEQAHTKAKARHTQLADSKDEPESHPEIVKALKEELDALVKKLPQWLETIANRVYHSRSGRLIWRDHPDKPDCHLLDFSLLTKDERKVLTTEEKRLAGQRGLSIERIEQLEKLRKRCQSLNQILRRPVGCKPPMSRDDSIPDPCPTILAKLDDIKEQRRNQTAHMILGQALGLTLAKPSEPKDNAEAELREAKDIHGEYVKADAKGQPLSPEKGNVWRGIVDFIVIEDLSRYRTSQGRAPRENSRLMKWCHRAIRDKLKQMCEPFGLPLVETPAAYSSRFCSRTGVAGFRAVELSGNPLEESKWRWRIRKPEEGKAEAKEQITRREQWELLFQQVQAANKGRDGRTKGQQLRTLLVPDAGGSIFVPISKLNTAYTRPAKNPDDPKHHRPIVEFEPVALEESQTKQPRLIHADINAAVNLGLRTVADPRLWSVHSRLRSEREFGNPQKPKAKKSKTSAPEQSTGEAIKPDKFWVSEKEKRKYGEQTAEKRIEIKLLDAGKANLKASDSRHPNFFNDVADLKTWIHGGAATLEGLPDGCPTPAHLVSGKALWGYVKELSWKRCMAINAARLLAWKIEPPKEWEA